MLHTPPQQAWACRSEEIAAPSRVSQACVKDEYRTHNHLSPKHRGGIESISNGL